MSVAHATFVVQSGQGAYDVDFFESETELRHLFAATTDARFVVDERIVELYPSLFTSVDVRLVYALPATEDEKTLGGVERLCRFLQATDASKATQLVVVGGGIVQDIAAFAAHSYYRGIPYVLVPTTLLSMADSCIGAKCGVNLGHFKNQLGFFASPKRVAIYRQFTQTLAYDDLRSGFGEVLKLAITDSADAFAWLESSLEHGGFASVDLDQAIRRSLETKRRVIEIDEYEANLRKTLNYGHSFSHAIEGLTDHGVPHGLGVAWGVDLANFVAMRRGLLATDVFARIHTLIAKHFAFEVVQPYDAAGICSMLKRDKKAAAGSITLILPEGLGKLARVPTVVDAALETIISEYLDTLDIFRPRATA